MSESPEEQPSTGVLGRIGSWFSPWKGKAPKTFSENALPAAGRSFEDEGEENVRTTTGGQEWETENPTAETLGDLFPGGEEDATQSAHRDGCAVSRAQTQAGGPKEAEPVAGKEGGEGQGREREGRRSGAPAGRIPEENATLLTHPPTSREQGVAWDPDRARGQSQSQRRARTGKRLHVYLEETSVVHCGQDAETEQEVFRTTVTKNLQVLPKFKSPLGVDTEESGADVRSVVDSQGDRESNRDSQSERDRDPTETNSMGRKNAARRRSKKIPQGDGGNPPQEKTLPNAPPATGTTPRRASSQGEGSDASVEPAGSSSTLSSTSQASPGGGRSQTSFPGAVKELDHFQDSTSESAASQVCAVDTLADMDQDRFYKVERKTETPESKRRSIKVSRSEVKIFPKYVSLKPNQASGGDAAETRQTEADGSVQKAAGEPRPHVGRIADRINVFEPQRPAGDRDQAARPPRSADVSPDRTAADRPKADSFLDQRSRSAERYDVARSGSASPARAKPMTIRERAKIFDEHSASEAKVKQPQIPAPTGISQQSASSVKGAVSKIRKLDVQGKLDVPPLAQTEAAEAGKEEGAAGSVHTSTSESQVREPKGKEPPASGGDERKAERSGDSVELGPQPDVPIKTGPRSKRRKSKELAGPVSTNNQNKPGSLTNKLEVTASEREQVAVTEEAVSASEQPTEKDLLPSDEGLEKPADKRPPSHTEVKTSTRDSEVPEKPKTTAFQKTSTGAPADRQEGSPEVSVVGDEPDTAACGGGTEETIDRGAAVLPQKEEGAERHSPPFTPGEKNVSEEKRETSAPCPPATAAINKQNSHIQSLQLDQESQKQLESFSKGGGRKSRKGETEQTQRAQNKETESKASAKTNQPAESDKGETQTVPSSDENTSKGRESGRGTSGRVGSFRRDDESKTAEKNETRPNRDRTKAEANQPAPSSHSSAKTQESGPLVNTEHISPVFQSDKASASGDAESNEAAGGHGGIDKEPPDATDVPPELQRESAAERPGTKAELPVIGAGAQPKSVSVEKTQNSPDDSCSHGSNDARLSGTQRINKTAPAVERVTVTVSNNTAELDPGQRHVSNQDKSQHSLQEASAISVSQSENAQGGKEDGEKSTAVKSTPSPGNVENISLIDSKHGESKKYKESKSSATLLRDPQTPPVATEKSAEETAGLPGSRLPSVANGDISTNPPVHVVTEEPVVNEPSQTPKAPASPGAQKSSPDATQRSSMKKLHLPRSLARDDSSKWQDAPSSWLDVDFPKQKLRVPEPKLTSSGSESNLLDTPDLDDDDFVARIKNLCAPFSLPPRRPNPLRQAQPPFAMPAIREDRFEKVFDPEQFTFGLRKKSQYSIDTSQSLLSKVQTAETKPSIKPARASIADRCLLLGAMDTHSRLREKTGADNEEEVKEETDEQVKVKSRLDGSCVLSSLTSSSLRGKRNGVQAPAEGAGGGDVSPGESPQVSPPPVSLAPPPSPTAAAPFKFTSSRQSEEEAASGGSGGSGGSVVTDSGAPLPSFNDLKLPDYLQKYLPQDPAKPAQDSRGQDQVRAEPTGVMASPASGADAAAKAAPALPDRPAPRFPGILPDPHAAVPELRPPQRTCRNNVPAVKRGFHKRPGKMVLFEKAQFGGQAYEIHRDLADATSLRLSSLISVKVVRGCWVLYEKPDFQGRTIALEEGGTELADVWAEPGPEAGGGSPVLIGSIRLAVADYSIPHIDLFTEPEGRGRVTPYHDDTEETGSFGIPQSTASIQVHSGVWLVCSDPGFQGMVAVLERGQYPVPESWGFPSPFVGSLRPLKMGGFKVENPDEVKALVYEKPGFEGRCRDVDGDVLGFCEDGGGVPADGPKTVGSLKITGGFWVGYTQPGFEGQQVILEEGEYADCGDWGGGELLSLRPVLSDFMTPHLKMFSDRNFGKLGVDIDLSVPVINMDDTGYGVKTQSINVVGGVWVIFDRPGFCGEPYVLEKGLYGSPEDWGAQQHAVGSTMPILLDDFETAAKFKVQLFSNPGFQGSVLTLEDGMASPQDGFSVASAKVLAGSWLAFEGEDFTGKLYVLDEGSYGDLQAMGCVGANAAVMSLQPVGFEFSLPSVTLFERCDLRGKRVVLAEGSVNLPLAGGCGRVQSLLVDGGIWVLYEGINYRGAQIVLKPGEVLNWQKFSGWQKIGSLRQLTQKQVHFRLRNKQTGLLMSVSGELSDVKLMRIQGEEETNGLEQIWFYHNGRLHCKILEECCLSPTGSVTMAGSRLGLSPETADKPQRWSITPQGFVRYTHSSDLVLDFKGGHHYDKNQVVLSTLDPNKPQQQWTVEIL